jgi:putative DNA primase/helicase
MNSHPNERNPAGGPGSETEHSIADFHAQHTPLAAAAQQLAAAGWKVFPLKPGTKLPAIKEWPTLATSDPATVAHWWKHWPDANVALLTGHLGVMVLDVDCKDGALGFDSLQRLQAEHGPLPATLTARTASGGLHLYASSSESIRNSASKVGPGLDLRGHGGFVVAPPSLIGGRAYTWESLEPIAAAPAWLVQLALAAAPVSAAATSEPVEVEVTDELLADLRSALQVLDASDRDVWISCAGALRCLGDAGFAIWLDWSQTSDKYQDGDEATFYTVGADRTGYAAVLAKAQAAGWINPRSTLARAAGIFGNGTPATVTGEPIEAAFDPCSHVSNGQRIVQHFGDRLLYVVGIGWHVWKDRWTPDDLGAKRIVQGLGKVIANEAAALGSWVADAPDYVSRDDREAIQKKRWKWAGQSEQEGHLESSLRLASTMLSCAAGDMDADPMLLGLPGGVLDLNTCTMRPYERADRISRAAGCNFDPDATAPTWERFIADVTGGDVELAAYLQRLAGYMLSGHRREHVLPVLFGAGANGKSTWVSTLQAMLGDYASAAPAGLLIQSSNGQHASATAALFGRRLVVVSETGEFGKLQEEQTKALTGGDRITARRLYQEPFEFTPTHLLVVMTNHKPRIAGTDEGIWRRLRLIPFTIVIPPERRDQTLPDKLLAELPGVLAWAVRGFQAYRRDGLGLPAAVSAATAEYRDASDQIGAWIADCCDVDAKATSSATELYASYSAWCTTGNERPRSQRDVGMRLRERGFERERGAAGMRWHGLKVCNPFGKSGLHNLSTASR